VLEPENQCTGNGHQHKGVAKRRRFVNTFMKIVVGVKKYIYIYIPVKVM